MGALLDLLRENEAAVRAMPNFFQIHLQHASSQLKILDPEHGGGGAHQVRCSRSGQVNVVIAGMDKNLQQQGLVWCKRAPGGA